MWVGRGLVAEEEVRRGGATRRTEAFQAESESTLIAQHNARSVSLSAGRGQSAHHSTTGKTNSIIRLIKTKNARWVSKSLSKSNEGAGSGCPITKYHRKLLSALWKGETNVTSIHVQLEKQNLDRSGNLAQCAKVRDTLGEGDQARSLVDFVLTLFCSSRRRASC